MRQPPKLSHLQLNLSLTGLSKATVPNEQQRELELALPELLIRAAQEHLDPLESEASHEPETHR